ncbi:hypothetical protein [Roseinatronobacter sp.]|uniref:hypothetical protein n=1 Tax=Roseinatronobacter sp. TaxID=1945755 RepID=UPI0025E95451|nr:hypothetical protein [Roseibaca sp.]
MTVIVQECDIQAIDAVFATIGDILEQPLIEHQLRDVTRLYGKRSTLGTGKHHEMP